MGVLDWGIGGVGLLRELEARAPALDIVYLSDAGVTPYGKQPPRALEARVRDAVRWLAERGCEQVALACNAASTTLARLGPLPVPVEGIIEHGIACVVECGARRVGVVGGARTVRAGAHRRALASLGIHVVSRVAQPLSAHIEAGLVESARFAEDLARIVRPLAHLDALLLACTHYPAAMERFAAALPGVALLDPAVPFALALARRARAPRGAPRGARAFFTTGSPRAMEAAARAAWGVELGAVARLPVDLRTAQPTRA